MWSHGVSFLEDGRRLFRVWAPRAERVDLRLLDQDQRLIPMATTPEGYFEAVVDGSDSGTQYLYRLNRDRERADPASRFQPGGVHGPSQLIPPSFDWQDDAWRGLPLSEYILYELHTGTFTSEGTFEAIIPELDTLAELGVTVIELMPVAQFPGARNWGYDGVFPFAAQNSYGGPQGLKRLVNACHQRGLGVALDVVYNHLGPEGNYLADFGPYFTDRYRTPWGPAINFDGPDSDPVRRFFIENALYWITECRVDALRLDAVHAIFDQSACPFLEELGDAIHECGRSLNRQVHVIPESSLNDTRLIRPKQRGGFALDAQWNDDFHHALRTVLTADRAGYYADFGRFSQMEKSWREGYVYSGQYSVFRRRRHGNSSRDCPAHRFVVFSQNHDQVGNRMLGERLATLVSFETLKVAAAAVLLSPFLPLLFMGEEYGETAPFLYFVSHSDADLIEAVRRGRREEFAAFAWQGEAPDPQSEETFLRSKLNRALRHQGKHAALWAWYRELIRLRRQVPALADLSKERMEVQALEQQHVLLVRRWSGQDQVLLALSFGDAPVTVAAGLAAGPWQKLLDSAGSASPSPHQVAGGPLARLPLNPRSAVLYRKGMET